MDEAAQIREHMPVVGSDGGHVGTVDGLEAGRLRLTRGDDPGGAGEHRFLPLRLVAACEGGQVRLTLPAQDARAVAFGALGIGEEDEAAAPEGGQVANRADQGMPDMIGQAGSGSGMVHGGGTTAHGGSGLGDEKPHGGGTGGGGTTRHGHLGSGPGIPDDPNMNPGGAKDPGA